MKQFLHVSDRSIWRIRDARIILPARAVSAAGNALTMVALLLLLHDAGAGPVAIAGLMACVAIPAVATMGIAGHVADTRDSRTILVVSTAAQLVACVVLALDHSAYVIFPVVIISQVANAFSQPTWSALVPRVVGEDRIGVAVSWQQGLGSIAAPVGMAAGGVIVGLSDVRWAFWIDAVTFAVLLVAALLVRTRRGGPQQMAQPPRMRWSAGIQVIRADRVVWPLFLALMPFVLLVEGVNPAEIFLARDALGASPIQYGLSDIFSSVGAVVGAWLAGRIVGARRWSRATLLGFGLSGLALVGAGVAPSFWVYAVILAGLAGAFSVGNAAFGAMLMSRTPDADRGKVQAALGGVARTFSLLALGLGGLATTLLGPRPTFVLAGVAGMLVMIIAAIWLSAGRRRTRSGHGEDLRAGVGDDEGVLELRAP